MSKASDFSYFTEGGRSLDDLGLALQDRQRFNVILRGFSVKAPLDEGAEFLLVLRGQAEDGTPMVSFTSATTLGECVRSCVARLRNNTMKWREDEFAGKR